MSREKEHDEIYCRSCGEPIKKKAEICPECGVSNEFTEHGQRNANSYQKTAQTSQSGNTRTPNQKQGTKQESITDQVLSPDTRTHDPEGYTTTVSENWHYAITASLVLWVGGLALADVVDSVSGFAGLIAWVLMPVGIYFDRQWVRATTRWDPLLAAWLIASVIPIVNLVAGGIYLLRRRNVSQVSTPNRGSSGGSKNNAALDHLRERYSKGELTDEEFERKVEELVGTEDEDVAKMHMRSKESSEEK